MEQGSVLINWNVQWATPGSARGRVVMDQLAATSPDLIVLTEGRSDLLPPHGHVVDAGDDWGYPSIGSMRRKVLAWSSRPWTDVDQIGSERLPGGRWVAATTMTAAGPVRIAAVCIPWSGAHVTSGRRDRAVWEDHLDYCAELAHLLRAQPRPLVVVGDFNQRSPRMRQPSRVHSALMAAVEGLCVATAGDTMYGQLIDHIAHDPTLRCEVTRLLPMRIGGLRVSDHVGVVADVRPAM